MPIVPRPPRILSVAACVGLIRRPDLWVGAVVTGAGFVDPGWRRRTPPLPAPPTAYLEMRHQTMFGTDPTARLGPDELVAYLEWCARMRRLAR